MCLARVDKEINLDGFEVVDDVITAYKVVIRNNDTKKMSPVYNILDGIQYTVGKSTLRGRGSEGIYVAHSVQDCQAWAKDHTNINKFLDVLEPVIVEVQVDRKDVLRTGDDDFSLNGVFDNRTSEYRVEAMRSAVVDKVKVVRIVEHLRN